MDAVIKKSRYLIIGFGISFVALNVYNIYQSTLGDSNTGIVLVKYSIQAKSYTIADILQRSIYLQVLLFSANGIYTTFVDKTMKLMVFATGNIYKSTGRGFEHSDRSNNDQIAASRRSSKMILGKETFIYTGTEWRVKWSQRGIVTFSFLAILCYIVGLSTSNNIS